MPKHSAEFLRGALAALKANERIGAEMLKTNYRALLAEAEAREAAEPDAAQRLGQAALMAAEPWASDLRDGAAALRAMKTYRNAAAVIAQCKAALETLKDKWVAWPPCAESLAHAQHLSAAIPAVEDALAAMAEWEARHG